MSLDEIVDKVLDKILKQIQDDKVKPHHFQILSPIVRQKKGEFKDLFDNLRSKGYQKVIVDGKLISLNEEINLIKTNKHTIEAVIDSFSLSFKEMKNDSFKNKLRSRLVKAVEQALMLSDGLVILTVGNDRDRSLFSEKFSCPTCNISLPEIEPRMFSFNSPLGACEKCHGIGTIFTVDPDLVLNKNLSINEGGILPFNKFFFHDTWYTRLLKKMAQEEGIDLNKEIGRLGKGEIRKIMYGTDKVYRVPGVNRYGRRLSFMKNLMALSLSLSDVIFHHKMESVRKFKNICGKKFAIAAMEPG